MVWVFYTSLFSQYHPRDESIPIIDQSVVIELNQEPCVNKPAELRMRVEDRVVSRGR